MLYLQLNFFCLFAQVAMHNRTTLGMPVTAEQKLTMLPEA